MIIKKKKYFTQERILLLIIAVLTTLSLFMIFADCTFIVGNSTGNFSSTRVYLSGIDATFGKSGIVNFSFGNLICYILVLISLALTLVKFFKPFPSRLFTFILFALLLACSVLFFSSGAMMVLAEDKNSAVAAVLGITISKHLAYGAIISGVLCLISSTVAFCLAIMQPKQKVKK